MQGDNNKSKDKRDRDRKCYLRKGKTNKRNISVITLSVIKYKMAQHEEILKFGMCHIIKDI